MNYLIIFEKSHAGWAAYVPDLPGCITTGRSERETQRLIRQAIKFHIQGLKQDNLPIPEPSATAEMVSAPRP